MFHSIRSRVAVPFVILILVIMGGLNLYLSGQVRTTILADLQSNLANSARLLAATAAPHLAEPIDQAALDGLTRQWASLVGARVTIVDPEGVVIGESAADRTQMDNHLTRVEIRQALNGRTGTSTRFSQTVAENAVYVAVPILLDGEIRGALRLALPLTALEQTVDSLQRSILTATVIASLLAIALALLIAERTARPIRRLTEVVQEAAAGDLSARLFPTTRDEVGELTGAFNHMTDQLRQQMDNLGEQSSRLATILAHLADGILIVDDHSRIRLVNPAALRLLGATETAVIGQSFAEVVRHHQLIALLGQARDLGEEQLDAVEIDPRGHYWQIIVTPFREGRQQRYLVMLQDVTQIRRLEIARRDFVSNISHELRTPLASLKAVIETLRDGALEDPPAAQRFLSRAEVEVDTLTQMVQELLELSRIESGRVPLRLAPTAPVDFIEPAVDRLREQAERAGLRLQLRIDPDLPPVLADTERVQQVVTNLVHNAIKFTHGGGRVTVKAFLEEAIAVDDDIIGDYGTDLGQSYVIVEVRDTGVGIPPEELHRIFERFYKADRARSGGGTGLGLAIAKHIIQAHGGQIWVNSREGKGSNFFFSLPVSGDLPAAS